MKSHPEEDPKARDRFERTMRALFEVPKSAVAEKQKPKRTKKKRGQRLGLLEIGEPDIPFGRALGKF